MGTRRYEKNPYSVCIVRVMCRWSQDYADARKILDSDPDDERAKVIVDLCMDFAGWMHELTGFGKRRMGDMLMKMMEVDIDEE